MTTIKALAREWLLPPGFYRFLRDEFPRMWWRYGSRHPMVHLDPDSQKPANLIDLLACAYGQILWVETRKLFAKTGRPFTAQQHPFVSYYHDGDNLFLRYHRLRSPRTKDELFLRRPGRVGHLGSDEYPVCTKPWDIPAVDTGHGSRRKTHGVAQQVPISALEAQSEMKRLDALRDSVQDGGFRVLRGDHIRFGQVLVNDEVKEAPDYRVEVFGGEHRTSLLAFLDWPVIPMIPDEGLRWREVRLSGLPQWPGVLNGTFTRESAREFFLAHFEFLTE